MQINACESSKYMGKDKTVTHIGQENAITRKWANLIHQCRPRKYSYVDQAYTIQKIKAK